MAHLVPEKILAIYASGQGDPDLLIRLVDETVSRLKLIESMATWRAEDSFLAYLIHDEGCR